MDKIILKNMRFYGYHGLLSEEKVLGQRFSVDLELYTNLKAAGVSDRMEDSINYAEVYNSVKNVLEGPSHDLIESVVHQVTLVLFESFPLLNACRVRLTKPDAPIPGQLDSVAVEVFREREE